MEKDNSTLKLILIGALVILVPVVLFCGMFLFSGDEAGASTEQPIDMTNSAHAQAISALDTMLDPLKTISEKADSVDAAKTSLDGLKVRLESDQIPFCTMDGSGKCSPLSNDIRAKIQVEFNNLDSYLNLLQTKAQNPNNKTDITEVKKKIATSIQNIQLCLFGGEGTFESLKNIAIDIINYNQSTGNIPYHSGGSTILNNGNKEDGIDCSGFMTYLLKKSGVIGQGFSRLTTRSIKDVPSGFTLITQSKDDYKNLIQPGDLIVKYVNDDEDSWHVGMYIGTSYAQDKTVVESTGTGRKMPYTHHNGPQFATVDSFTSAKWLASSKSNIWVVRPTYR